MSTFIPNLTKKTNLMCSLLERNSHLVWTSDMQKELNTIRNDITSAVELIHYSPIYTTENFWHGSDKNGTRTPKKGSARVNFVV